jgi:hypothetical protein
VHGEGRPGGGLGQSKEGKELGLARFGEEIGQLGQNEGEKEGGEWASRAKEKKKGKGEVLGRPGQIEEGKGRGFSFYRIFVQGI